MEVLGPLTRNFWRLGDAMHVWYICSIYAPGDEKPINLPDPEIVDVLEGVFEVSDLDKLDSF